MSNNIDKERYKMNIQINNIQKVDDNANESIIKSKQIICPECHEKCLINIIDYKIRLYDWIHVHEFDSIVLEDFENTQKNDESQINYDKCINKNKNNSYNKTLYRCNTCQKIYALYVKISTKRLII